MKAINSISANITGEKAEWSFETHPHKGEAFHAVQKWVRESTSSGLFLYGSPGTGKTGLVVSALREMIESGIGNASRWDYVNLEKVLKEPIRPFAPVWYEWWPKLLRRFYDSISVKEGEEETRFTFTQLQDELLRCVEVLALDDFDIPTSTSFREEIMVWFIDEFSDKGRRLIITTNRSSTQELIPILGDRVVSRLFEGRKFRGISTGTKTLR